jgi:undecaprenyl-diphosphatase
MLGRFFGPIRAIIPFIAGMLDMSPKQFLAVNIASALLWAPAYLIPGMLFGNSLQETTEMTQKVVLVRVTAIAASWALFRFVQFVRRRRSEG